MVDTPKEIRKIQNVIGVIEGEIEPGRQLLKKIYLYIYLHIIFIFAYFDIKFITYFFDLEIRILISCKICLINSYSPNVTFLYPLKTFGFLTFSGGTEM